MNVINFASGQEIRRRRETGLVRQSGPVTVILPFFNEAKFIPATLNSLLAQRLCPTRIVLVDNASTDDGAALCRAIAAKFRDIEIIIVNAARPGKLYALEVGQNLISTEYVAFCDADTFYPPQYFETALNLLDRAKSNAVGALAVGVTAPENSPQARRQIDRTILASKIFTKQCHCGGFGQIFRTRDFRAVGGYDSAIWPFVLEDHEIVHRLLSQGEIVYDENLWCETSPRRSDRKNVSWSRVEQLLYLLTPFELKRWFFYSLLAGSLRSRRLSNEALREQPWAA